MAKNWTVAEAINEVVAGNKEAIVDLGKRFPLTTVAMASDPKKILEALNFITVRKIESILKDGVQVIEDDEEGITDPITEKPEEKKTGRGRKAKKEEPMNEPVEEEEVDLKKMSEVELFKLAKKKGLKPEPKKNKKYYIDLITKADEPAEEEDWDDEEEEKPAKKAPAKKEAPKKEAPKKVTKKAEVEDDDDWDI